MKKQEKNYEFRNSTDDNNAVRRAGDVHLRHEPDERRSAEISRREDEKRTCHAYKESFFRDNGRCPSNSSASEQQCNYGYGNRFCKCRSDEAAAGYKYNNGGKYRNDNHCTADSI